MSRSTTRARNRNRKAAERRASLTFLDHMRAAEFDATGKHSSLGLLAASRMAEMRATVDARYREKVSPDVLPHTVHDVPKPSAMPRQRTLWQAATGTLEPVTTPEPVKVFTAPELKTRTHTPIKAAELDKEMRAAAMRIVRGDDSFHGWQTVGVINREDGRVTVYVRKHGASVRYSTAPTGS
ncbi:hypothetical protein AB0M10_15275 [Streptomyces sp. NPDC051840]|uniref:hypothetical protein n=1 Tax=Streptomyces sp. NPDC051840 TaxID=3154752 RepID=UPI00341865AA